MRMGTVVENRAAELSNPMRSNRSLSPRLMSMRDRVWDRDARKYRTIEIPDVLAECEANGLSWTRRVALLVKCMCETEVPVIEVDEKIVFTRTVSEIPSIWSEDDWNRLRTGRRLHELGPINNICADWEMVLSQGLDERKRVAQSSLERLADDAGAVEFLESTILTIDSVLMLAEKYAQAAHALGRDDVAETLRHVPAKPPRTFHEALQMLRLLHAVVWMSGHYHVGLGRFDQYMWPYLKADLDSGRITEQYAEELLAEFFISLNKDSDLYFGIQQGDNGQSIMLGGVTRDGRNAVNELTCMVLRASRDVSMIDPKINLRITSDTDLELLELASELTRQGLGFPQYSNDDVVIPALTKNGYDIEDARDYIVAACWEFIVPGRGMEIVNIGAVSFPAATDQAIRKALTNDENFDELLVRVNHEIADQVKNVVAEYQDLILPPAPWYSVLMTGCLESGKDLSQGLKYNNFGIHGSASANAADALAAVKKYVYDEQTIDPKHLIDALDNNFKGTEELRELLFEQGPKVGNNEELPDGLMSRLFDNFADACEAIGDNGRGGRVRPGTGSAMYYVWLATGNENMLEPVVGATADGRHEGEYFSSSLAPSPGVKVKGPISVLQSYSKIDYSRIYNGGPVTMEVSDTVFRNPHAIRKVALLIRTFTRLGCQQLQVNSLNVETLKEAKRHPEKYKNLIVRVWGWSGYFCELGPEYQDQIIARNMYGS